MVKEYALKNGAFRAVVCNHWAKGGEGALELADAVIAACEKPSKFEYLYPLNMPIQDKIQKIATEMYGAGQVEYSDEVLDKIKEFTKNVSNLNYLTINQVHTVFRTQQGRQREPSAKTFRRVL